MIDKTLPNTFEQVLQPSTYENIDGAVLRYVDETLNLHSQTNKGWTKTPVVWKGSEISFQIKHDKEIKDHNGSLKLPLISIFRTKEEKNSNARGAIYGQIPVVNDVKGGSYVITRRILQDKTSKFANADAKKKSGQINFRTRKNNEKIVYQTISIPQPVYVMCHYEIKLMSEYIQQMNQLKTSFITKPGAINHIYVFDDHHKYEAFIDDSFTTQDNIDSMSEESRYFETNINIRVLGYLIGEGNNQEKPKMIIRENAVEIRFPRERVLVEDSPEDLNVNSFYRES